MAGAETQDKSTGSAGSVRGDEGADEDGDSKNREVVERLDFVEDL